MEENLEKNIVNKIIVVTGGSRGIGAQIVKELASCGYTVVLNYNNSENSAKSVENELKKMTISLSNTEIILDFFQNLRK